MLESVYNLSVEFSALGSINLLYKLDIGSDYPFHRTNNLVFKIKKLEFDCSGFYLNLVWIQPFHEPYKCCNILDCYSQNISERLQRHPANSFVHRTLVAKYSTLD